MYTIKPTDKENLFIGAYFEAIDFTESDGEFDTYSGLDETFERESFIDCLAFYSKIACYLSDNQIEQAGHDFWLTRNGHGAGFWDRPELYGKNYADMFTTISKHFGEVYAIYNELNLEQV